MSVLSLIHPQPARFNKKSDSIVNTNKKGKEKVVEASVDKNYPRDSNFEDEIPITKRLRLNNDPQLTVKSCLKVLNLSLFMFVTCKLNFLFSS